MRSFLDKFLITKKNINFSLKIGFVLIFFSLFSHSSFAATYNWNQSDWSGGANESNNAIHEYNQNNWDNYFSKESTIEVNPGTITLSSTTDVVTNNSYSDFSPGSMDETNINDSGEIKLSLSQGNVSLEGGSEHTCVSTSDGSVYCWGQNSSGQLGDGTGTSSPIPVQVVSTGGIGYLTNVKQVSTGTSHTCAVKNDGTVWCWGLNTYGCLGNGSNTSQNSPVQVKGVGNIGFLTNISKVAAGESHTCAISNDGYVYCWGYGAFGPLGNNSSSSYNYPVRVIDSTGSGYLSNIIDISTSDRYSCAVKGDGTGWCWGLGNWGQIGDGTQTESNLIPKQVSQVTTFTQIDAGIHGHSCGVTSGKEVYCWGWGDYGSMGNGTNNAYQTTPTQVININDAKEVSAGYYHSCAVRDNGTVACWGGGDDGQLGNGTNTHTVNTYVTVSNLSDAIKVTSGAKHSCALKSDGTVVCWGNDGSGRLGNNSTTNSNIPVNTLNNNADGQLYLSGFASQGTFISNVFNLNGGGMFFLSLGYTKPANTSVKVEFRTASSLENLSTANWFGPSGEDTYFTDNSYNLDSPLYLSSYTQYRIILETSNPLSSPSVSSVQFKYKTYQNSGFLISSPYDTETDETLVSGVSWIEDTPNNSSIKFQIRTAANDSDLTSKEWKGPDDTDASYFTDNINNTTPNSFKDQLADRWIQYKVFLATDNNSVAPTLYDSTITYVVNDPPQFDSTYQTNGFGITRSQTPGIFNFLYKVRDTDTNQALVDNQYKLWPSFQYSTDGGSSWTTISTDQLSGKTVDNPINLTDNSNYVEEVTVWDARSVLPDTFTSMLIRIIIDDREAANNTSSITSDSFYFDTKTPTVNSVTGGGIGININNNQLTSLGLDKTNNQNVTLYFSATDDSDLKIRYSTDSSFTGVDYQDYISSVGFTLPSNDGVKTVYAQFEDIYGNESPIYSDSIQVDTTAPNNPDPLFSQDISNTNNDEYRIFLNWPKSINTDWAEYKIYLLIGDEFILDQTINNIDTNYIVKNNLTDSTDYTFKITSLDDLNNESIGVTIIQNVGNTSSDTMPPEVTDIGISNIDSNSAVISWSTDELSTTSVLYSLDQTELKNSKGVDEYSLNHSVTVVGLSSNTQYFYKIHSVDPFGNISESDILSFSTLSTDDSGPNISDIDNSNFTHNGVTITFTTDEAASSFIEYSTESGFSQGVIFGQSNLVTSHSINLTSLNPSTTYFYKIRSSDVLSNETVSDEYSFTTSPDPTDTTSPTISNTVVSSVTHNTATITFLTNENTVSYIEYGLDNNYGQLYGNNLYNTNHSITLPNNLSAQTTYYFRTKVIDISGNETLGLGSTFTTTSNPADITPPSISDIEIENISQNSATISWQTNELSDSYIGFSTDQNYSSEQGSSLLTVNHSITLIGLSPATSYYFRVKSKDSSGNISLDNNNSVGYNFITLGGHAPPLISSIETNNVATDSAEISWNTDTTTNSFVEYWLNETSIFWYGNNNIIQAHKITIPGLVSDSTYFYRVHSKDSSGSEAISDINTFSTLNIGTTTSNNVDDSSEEGILDRIKHGTVDFIKQVIDAISDSPISEDDLTTSLNSMTPNIVSSPSISSGNIMVDPGVDKITITWVTDKKSNSVVAYTLDSDYDPSTSQYPTEVGDYDELVTSHSVELTNLNPNTTYHYKVRSKSTYGNWADSDDYTFTTLSINSKINDFHFTKVSQNSVAAAWSTNFDSRATIDVVDVLSGKSVTKSEEKGFSKSHEFTTDQFESSTNYQLKITLTAKDGTVSEESVFPFSTSISSDPPEISNVRISNALISGAVEQVQTIISWKTDKPSTSRIIYTEGTSDDLNQSTSLDKTLVTDHVVVTTNLSPGKVYKFKAESVDAGDNTALSKDYLIMTPKPQQSVLDLIIDNFASSFSFITGGNK